MGSGKLEDGSGKLRTALPVEIPIDASGTEVIQNVILNSFQELKKEMKKWTEDGRQEMEDGSGKTEAGS